MTRRNTTFLIAVGLSVAIHTAMFLAAPCYEVGGVAIEWPSRGDRTAAGEMTVVLEAEPEPEAEAERQTPPEFEMGAKDATGYAAHEVADEVEATAREADADQAYLSLDPTGAGERGRDAAVSRAAGGGSTIGRPGGAPPRPPPPPGSVAAGVTPPRAGSSTPFGVTPQFELPRRVPKPPAEPGASRPDDSLTDTGENATTRPAEPPPRAAPPTSAATEQSEAVAAVEIPKVMPQMPARTSPRPGQRRAVIEIPTETPEPIAAPSPDNGGAQIGGSQQPAADPARMSDSESDPFSRLGTATVRDGRLQIRFGRKVKTRRPKLLLAGQVDLLTLQRAQVVLRIAIDATGKVTSVKVDKSSGSNEIDQPTRVAVYDWWFEPKRDASGRPVADELRFTIGWR